MTASFSPLIFRIASWPIESVLPLRSPELAARVDSWLDREASLGREASELSRLLFEALPSVSRGQDRALVLGIRRAIHRSIEPLDPEALGHVVHLRELTAQVRRRLSRHAARRRKWSEAGAALRQAHADSLDREVRYLRTAAEQPRFRRALAVASRAASDAWERLLSGRDEPLPPKLAGTLFRYLTRAAARATPNGLWAGVAMENRSRGRTTRAFDVRPADAVVNAQPDLAVIDRVFEAMRSSPLCRENLTWSLNPSVRHRGGRRWSYLRRAAEGWQLVDAHDEGLIKGLVTASRNGTETCCVREWANTTGAPDDVVREAIDAGLLWATVRLRANASDAWSCLDAAISGLPDAEREIWREARQELLAVARSLREPETLTVADFRHILDRARDIVNGLLARYGAAPLDPSTHVLQLDLRAPFVISVRPAVRRRIERAIEKYWAFDRAGMGELLARAERLRQASDLRNPLLSFGNCVVAGRQSTVTAAAKMEMMPSGLQQLAQRHVGRLTRAVQGARGDRLTIPRSWIRNGAPLAPGSALLMARGSGRHLVLRVGSLSPDWSTFYGRFHALFHQAAEPAFHEWLIGTTERVSSRRSIVLADLVPHAPATNALLRPRVGAEALRPFRGVRDRLLVDVDRAGRVRLRDGGGRRVVPLANTAADLGAADPVSRWFAMQAALLGRPALLRPQPPLPVEANARRRGPEVRLDRQTVIQVRRWFPQDLFGGVEGGAFDRFVAWRRYVRSADLPELTYVRTPEGETEFLMLSSSCLAVEALQLTTKKTRASLQFQEAFQDGRDMIVTDPDGKRYISEIAVAWRGDERFWDGMTRVRHQVQ